MRVALRHSLRSPAGEVLRLGGVSIDLAKRQALRDGKEIHLTPLELRLLACLAKHLGMVVTQRHLLAED